MHRVMIRNADYNSCRQAVEQAFDLFPLQIKNRKVVIKPNVLRASIAEDHIVTHPALVRAVVETVAALSPASLVVGDNPGVFNYGDNERSFEQTGLMAAAGEYYQNLGDDPVQVDFHADTLPRVGVSRQIMEADVLISLPKFKTHGLTVLTGAIKNSYGILPGGQKAKLHQLAGSPEKFHKVVTQVFALRVPDLFIMDAVIGMEGNGPASPELRDIGQILAADNAVAMDAVVARMMGLAPEKLRFMTLAQQMGLGHMDEDRIDIDGPMKVIPDFKIPPLGGDALMANTVLQDMLRNQSKVVPRAAPDLCTACGDCVDHCPVDALSIDGDLAVADADTCITCFCCQEICPEKAMTLV